MVNFEWSIPLTFGFFHSSILYLVPFWVFLLFPRVQLSEAARRLLFFPAIHKFFRLLGTVPRPPTTIGISLVSTFQSLFSSCARSSYLSISSAPYLLLLYLQTLRCLSTAPFFVLLQRLAICVQSRGLYIPQYFHFFIIIIIITVIIICYVYFSSSNFVVVDVVIHR